jgi:O-antigen biosynthesis protein
MFFRDSRLWKLWNLISHRGIRTGSQDALSVWIQDRLAVSKNVFADYRWVLGKNLPPELKRSSNGPLRINWILPDFREGSGGMFNILRTIYSFEQWGHTNRIYVSGNAADGKVSTEIARNKYFPINAEIELFKGDVADSDALIATSWPTAYVARTIGNTVRKFYFVQDMEHLFYAEGSLSEFAKETYRWGFYGITAGQWIADVLRREFGMECSAFGFSYDRDAYSPDGPRLLQDKTQKRVLFYARPATERRGFELGILALSLVAQKMPDVEFVLVGLRPRALELPFAVKIIPGKLTPSELGSLYRSCRAALVLSHTNLSLLPLELMASGCAVVSNSGPNVEWLLTDKAVQLARPTPEALASAIIALLQDDQLRDRQVNAGLELARATHWDSEIKSIESALYSALGVSSGARDE